MQSLADKYAPKTLDDLLLDDQTKKIIQKFLDKKTTQSLLLSGKQGIGKSTLANIIVNTLDATFLYINCGIDGNVDVMRNRVKEFTDSCAINFEVPKIVILDEADALSSTGDGEGGRSSAQGALRNIIDKSSDDTRFILTCNYLSRIIGPLQSRCTPMQLSCSVEDVTKRCIEIIKKEKVKASKENLKLFVKQVVKPKFPDIRTIINNLEQWIVEGELKPAIVTDDSKLDDVVYKLFEILTTEGLKNARTWYLNHEDLFNNDYHKFTAAIFNNLMGDENKQEIVGESLRVHPTVLDKEIEFYTMLIKLRKLI